MLPIQETNERIGSTGDSIHKKSISELRPTPDLLGNEEIAVSHVCEMTMIDGKMCNAIMETASLQTCYICRANAQRYECH